MSGQHTLRHGSWLDGLLAERQVYVRGPGRPHFITITRRARVLRAAAVLLLVLGLAGTTASLLRSSQHNDALVGEVAALRAGLEQAGGQEAARLREALDAERAARERVQAELEAARARASLLGGQLASAEEARDRATAELETARGEIDLARRRAAEAEQAVAAVRSEGTDFDRVAAEVMVLRAERDALSRRVAELEAQLQRTVAATPVATIVSADAGEAGPVVPERKPGDDVQAELAAALARLKELETYVGRRAPAPPAQAPR